MRIRLTVEGKKFLFLTLLVTFAAVNTANNLMYLVMAMMVSMLFVSYAALRLNMSGLAFNLYPDRALYAGQLARLGIVASNGKLRTGTYSLTVQTPEEFQGECRLPYISPGGEAYAEAEVIFNRRGLYYGSTITVRSGFPFIFFEGAKQVKAGGELLVYPEMVDVHRVLEAISGRTDEGYATRPGRGENFFGMREHRPGDDIRAISWKATARAGKLMVREFAEEEPRVFTVVLDDRMPLHGEHFERAVSLAASVCKALIDQGCFVKLVTCGKVLPMGTGPEHLHRVLEVLALVREGEPEKCVMEDEVLGSSVLVLKSAGSEPKGSAYMFDTVLYASEI